MLTPAQVEAIEVADANLNNADLTLYSDVVAVNAELLAALDEMVKAFNAYAPRTEGAEYNCVISARASIAKATNK